MPLLVFRSLSLPLLRAVAALILLGCALLAPAAPAFAQMLPTAPAAAAAADPAASAIDPQTQALIDILENDEARARLIAALRDTGAPPAPETEVQIPFARQVAEHTRALAEQVSNVFLLAGDLGGTVAVLWRDTTQANLEVIARTLGNLLVIMAATLIAFFILRFLSERMRRRFNEQAQASRLPRRLLLILAAIGVDVLAVALAWVIGNALSVRMTTNMIMGLNQALFLNAFLVAEGLKAASRAVFVPRNDALRLLPIDATSAHYWNFWIARIVSLVAYAFLFLAPIAAWNVSAPVGEAIRVVTVFTACTIGIVIVLQNKLQVRGLLLRRIRSGESDTLSRFFRMLASFWHVVAVLYFVAFFLVWIAQPRSALAFMIGATVESVIAIAVGILIVSFISRLIQGGMRLSPEVKHKLPLLEERLNAFVPKVLEVVRAVILLGVVIAILNAWDVFDFFGWASTGVGFAITTSLLSAALIILGALVIWLVVSSWIEYRLNPDYGTIPTARERTLLSLLRNAFTVGLVVVVAIMVLSEIGVNVGPLLAGAGVLGLAIGFGAQKMVQDVISGIFIQLENAMNEGDVVTAGGISGVVERLTIRSVSMRDLNGVYHVIPFSSVDMVSNMMRNFSYHVADMGVAYRENVADVKQAMQDAFDRLVAIEEHAANIIGPFEMMGVNAFQDSAVVVRGRIKTLPGKQWGTGRAYNEIIKEIFDERGIEIPFPHMTLYAGEDKKGAAPPFRIARSRLEREGEATSEGEVRGEAGAQEPQALPSPEETDESVAENVTDIPEESGKPRI